MRVDGRRHQTGQFQSAPSNTHLKPPNQFLRRGPECDRAATKSPQSRTIGSTCAMTSTAMLYFEQSSTINCVCTGIDTSAASGMRSTCPSGSRPFDQAEEIGHLAAVLGQVGLDHLQALRPVLDADHVAGPHQVAGNVHLLAVDGDVAVGDQLPGLGPRLGRSPSRARCCPAGAPAGSSGRRRCCPWSASAWSKYLRNCRSSTP